MNEDSQHAIARGFVLTLTNAARFSLGRVVASAKPVPSLPVAPQPPTRPTVQRPSPDLADQQWAARWREEEQRDREREQEAAHAQEAARQKEIARADQERLDAERRREANRKAEEEQERQRQLASKAQYERQERERIAAQADLQARAKAAATRNTAKIKALGLPAAFVNSTLYLNDMGNWTPFMPCAQWLGLLLESKKIASVEAISVRGNPGVSLKRNGQPASGVVFRMEGNEAYVLALVTEGKAEEIRSPFEHTLVGLALKESVLLER